MISAPPHARILVASKPVDFRKGLPGLSALVETVLQEDPFAGDVFIFRSKRADWGKILVWDGSGLWLHYKRVNLGAKWLKDSSPEKPCQSHHAYSAGRSQRDNI